MINTKTIKLLNTFSPIKEDFLIAQSSSTELTGKVSVENLFNIPLNNNNSILDNINSLQSGISTNNDNIITIQNSINDIQHNISDNSSSINNIQNTIIPAIQNDINELELAISSNLNNLLDGNNSGAIRSISSVVPNENYTMGDDAIALGYNTTASGSRAHAEGSSSIASGIAAHSLGGHTTASGNVSHAEGTNTTASGEYSHAEGHSTIASEAASHAAGLGTKAFSFVQTAIGKYNIEDINDKYAFILGNGTETTPSNALTIDWTGDVQLGFNRNAAIGTTDGDLINALEGANFISTIDTMIDVKKLFTQLTNRFYELVLISPNHFSVYPNPSYDFSAIIPGTNSSETPEIIPEDTVLFNALGSSKNGNVWLQVYTSPIQFLNGTGPKGTWVEFINSLPIAFRPVINYCTILYGIEPGLYKDNFINSLFLDNSTMNNNYIANYALLKITTDGIVSISPMNLNKKDSSSSNLLIYICNCNYTSAYSPV